MNKWRTRSKEKELLDNENIPQDDLFLNLSELHAINYYLGGYNVITQALHSLNLKKGYTYTVLDIGSGGGDTLKVIAAWGAKNGISMNLVGADIKADCIKYATRNCINFPNISFHQSDYRKLVEGNNSFDIICCSLFCHHLNDDDNKALFSWIAKHVKVAGIINDIHRHPIAYYSIKWLTALFSKSYLVKHDAALSVLRAFTKKECIGLMPNSAFSLSWKWAFRWQIILYPGK
ncbi:MAG: methyltransferase domain-containing protein [Bacteroidia bacterium]|jgi:2-polyprenyl-3-methyl-5-hydroxy-6-metoxy-1,4-benzoquinol methylase|nr:methyltransferase domain-containing protein [Bacteroidia bacterium]